MDTTTQRLLHGEIEQALGIAQSMSGDCHYRITVVGPPMFSAPDASGHMNAVTKSLLGPGRAKNIEPTIGSEHFFSDLVPAAMLRLGCRIENDERQRCSPLFDIDERCLLIGAAILAEGLFRLLCGSASCAEDSRMHNLFCPSVNLWSKRDLWAHAAGFGHVSQGLPGTDRPGHVGVGGRP
jgi:hypothetical protein